MKLARPAVSRPSAQAAGAWKAQAMLKELRITNFVLIDALTLGFGPGVCLLTGETGAGKSIVIDAIGAALGGRVSLDLIRAGAKKATIEATFQLTELPAPLSALLEEEGIERSVEGELTLSRELSPKGTRCRIEGQQVTLGVLRQAGSALVDVLAQHEHQELLSPPFHLALLDRFGALEPLREAVAESHARWSALRTERQRLAETAQARAQQRDFWAFQLAEIEAAGLKRADEAEVLESERLVLANAEALRLTAESAYEALYGSERSLCDQLGRVVASLKAQAALDPALDAAAQALESARLALRETSSDLRHHAEGLEIDPARLAEVDERLDLLDKLARKYGPGLEAVMAHAERVSAQLAEAERADDRFEHLDAAVAEAASRLASAARALSAARAEAAKRLEIAVEAQLAHLELPNARFVVSLAPLREEAPRATGAEAVAFEISLNPGEPPRAIAKVASGGELARVMLALKTVLAGLTDVPTLILDEVDVGISGKAAQAVAEKLAALGRHYQVLCITHLPTVAAMADMHVHLEKRVEHARTTVAAMPLEAEERARELSRMASGGVEGAAVQHAEELLARAAAFKAALAPAGGGERA